MTNVIITVFSIAVVVFGALWILWEMRWSPEMRATRYKAKRTEIANKLSEDGRHEEALKILLWDVYPDDIERPRIGL